jgi:hypothetical protein
MGQGREPLDSRESVPFGHAGRREIPIIDCLTTFLHRRLTNALVNLAQAGMVDEELRE